MKINRLIKIVCLLLIGAALIYGGGRLYYATTGGFLVSNITSDLAYDSQWDTHSLGEQEKAEISHALDQEYTYLGKGCQSYVFASRDGNYVIKFIKFQRFYPQKWINLFTFIPSVDRYQQTKKIEKGQNLNKLFQSWKIAYENLQPETGVVYVHLNKSDEWHKSITVRDKIGLTHTIDLDQMEFMVQRRASMLADWLNDLMSKGQVEEAKATIDRLITMLLSEYARGYADNDHAIMQNTGILDGRPIHIDAGQFIYNAIVKDPKVFKQEVYDKTFKLGQWLKKYQPTLIPHLESRLVALIGPEYYQLAPYVHKGDVGKIPHLPE